MNLDSVIGEIVGPYRIVTHLGTGAKGAVYKAESTSEVREEVAIKFVDSDTLEDDWLNEITKVVKLARTPYVVRYITHGDLVLNEQNLRWIAWDFIPGKSLRSLIDERSVTVALIVDVLRTALTVLHACSASEIEHGDLHAGNIIIEPPDETFVEQDRARIWITDFGHKTSSRAKSDSDVLSDLVGLNRTIQDALAQVDYDCLSGFERAAFSVLKKRLARLLLETNIVAHPYAQSPLKILTEYDRLVKDEFAPRSISDRKIGDYLVAEYLGERLEEWRQLFVPQFLALDKILERNPVLLTGLRGCGKTMLFRRISAEFNLQLGVPDIRGIDGFYGFYVNARTFAEAFPWLPERCVSAARPQVTHFFNLKVSYELVSWIDRLVEIDRIEISTEWLVDLFSPIFPESAIFSGSTRSVLVQVLAYIAGELEERRLKGFYLDGAFAFDRFDFIESFVDKIIQNLPIRDKPFYVFLDDYSAPMVSENLQGILNALVFRRPLGGRARIFFKVATESVESFFPYGVNGNFIEEDHDYKLVDLGAETSFIEDDEKIEFLDTIMRPRIDRDSRIEREKASLFDLLGASPNSFNEMARRIARGRSFKGKTVPAKQSGQGEVEDTSDVGYSGIRVFCSLWSSDVREMISILADMVGAENPDRLKEVRPEVSIISSSVQARVLSAAGGEFLSNVGAAAPFSKSDWLNSVKKLRSEGSPPSDESYGHRLVEVARAFHVMATYSVRFETSGNGSATTQKQARRIEITDVDRDLPKDVWEIYRGLIRYGVLIRDARGKSVRGRSVPRLYLRGLLIPYFRLSPSKRDSIQLDFTQFCSLLKNPRAFSESWIDGRRMKAKKRREKKNGSGQGELFKDEDNTSA